MSTEIPILPLSEPEKLWLQEVYQRNLCGQRFSARDIWPILHERIPVTFRPAVMDPRLIDAGGENIRLLGIIALQSNYDILPKADKVIRWIRQELLNAPATDLISTEAIAQGTGVPAQEVHLILQTIQEFGQFLRTPRTGVTDLFISAIELGAGSDVYYQYITFPGIEQLIVAKSYDHYRIPPEPFTFEEMKTANAGLDAMIKKILEEFNILKLGQEAIWTDIRNDIEELKSLYSLGKKNWWQLLIGKLTEMTTSGIISETLSKTILDSLKPGISHLLPW
ncbi:MAG TPA: hypothetical protein VGM30_19620 [Puia sp.]|jgi:hypothetical protein